MDITAPGIQHIGYYIQIILSLLQVLRRGYRVCPLASQQMTLSLRQAVDCTMICVDGVSQEGVGLEEWVGLFCLGCNFVFSWSVPVGLWHARVESWFSKPVKVPSQKPRSQQGDAKSRNSDSMEVRQCRRDRNSCRDAKQRKLLTKELWKAMHKQTRQRKAST